MPKSAAERQREYRERKKKEAVEEPVTPAKVEKPKPIKAPLSQEARLLAMIGLALSSTLKRAGRETEEVEDLFEECSNLLS